MCGYALIEQTAVADGFTGYTDPVNPWLTRFNVI
jgi:hypothetical protein